MSIAIDLKGKVIMITGAAGGIGAGTAKIFADAGASLLLTDISQEVLVQAEVFNSQGAKALGVIADISNPKDVETVVQSGLQKFGRLDFAFNNAGIGGKQSKLDELDFEDWDKVIRVNLSSVAYCMKFQVQAMKKTGGGVIINNSSVLGKSVFFDQSLPYAPSKHGIIGLTRQAAANHGEDNIRINAICPGFISTELLAVDGTNEQVDWFMKRTPLGRPGVPEDIGKMVLALCSDLGGYVTGASLQVDGGFLHS